MGTRRPECDACLGGLGAAPQGARRPGLDTDARSLRPCSAGSVPVWRILVAVGSPGFFGTEAWGPQKASCGRVLNDVNFRRSRWGSENSPGELRGGPCSWWIEGTEHPLPVSRWPSSAASPCLPAALPAALRCERTHGFLSLLRAPAWGFPVGLSPHFNPEACGGRPEGDVGDRCQVSSVASSRLCPRAGSVPSRPGALLRPSPAL